MPTPSKACQLSTILHLAGGNTVENNSREERAKGGRRACQKEGTELFPRASLSKEPQAMFGIEEGRMGREKHSGDWEMRGEERIRGHGRREK
jgi:hypothetical protein